jgi:hypothetical protein
MFTGLLGNINKKSLVLTIIVAFAYVFASDFIIHGFVLGKSYQETASLWRPEQEMQSYMLWMLLGQFFVASSFAVVFARGYEGKGIMEGIRFALLMIPFSLAPCFIQYAVTPIPSSLLWAWVGLGGIQALGAGVVVALIYSKA